MMRQRGDVCCATMSLGQGVFFLNKFFEYVNLKVAGLLHGIERWYMG